MTRNADLLVMCVAVELAVLTLFPTDVISAEDIGGAGSDIVFPAAKPVDVTTRRAPQVRAWERRAPEPPRKRLVVEADEARGEKSACAGTFSVVGDQFATENGAKTEAEKQWMATARFLFGERFMDPVHARRIQYACTRSSIGSLVGAVFHRCEMTATACSAPRIQTEK